MPCTVSVYAVEALLLVLLELVVVLVSVSFTLVEISRATTS